MEKIIESNTTLVILMVIVKNMTDIIIFTIACFAAFHLNISIRLRLVDWSKDKFYRDKARITHVPIDIVKKSNLEVPVRYGALYLAVNYLTIPILFVIESVICVCAGYTYKGFSEVIVTAAYILLAVGSTWSEYLYVNRYSDDYVFSHVKDNILLNIGFIFCIVAAFVVEISDVIQRTFS